MMSHPTMGAWIEIQVKTTGRNLWEGSHPTMGAWIEITNLGFSYSNSKSHPTMGAWIEICCIQRME